MYNIIYELLYGFCRVIVLFVLYMLEEMYRNLIGEVFVYLVEYFKCNEELVDIKLEEKMDLVKNLVILGRVLREVERIKVC